MVAGASLESILEEQFYLAYKAKIPISDSNGIPDFEREIFINMLLKDIKKRNEALNK